MIESERMSPIFSKSNNRYRGPIESSKSINLKNQINYNLKILKKRIDEIDKAILNIQDDKEIAKLTSSIIAHSIAIDVSITYILKYNSRREISKNE